MPTTKERITVNLDDEDYQWVDEKAELAGSSRAGIIRRMVRGLRLRKPGLLNFGSSELVFAEESGPTEDENEAAVTVRDSGESVDSGLESFSTE